MSELSNSFTYPLKSHIGVYNPGDKSPVWALPLSLATTDGIDSLSFPPVTEMFHFTGYCVLFPNFLTHFPSKLGGGSASETDNDVLPPLGYPIRKSPDHSVLTAPRGLSQLTASFIAC